MKLNWKKLPVFWVVFLSVFAFLVLVSTVGLIVLNGYLKAFEAAQPIHPAKEAFRRYFTAGNFEEVIEVSGIEVSEFESKESVSDAIKKLSEGKKMDFYSVFAKEGEASYNVVLIPEQEEHTEGGAVASEKLASIQLKKSEKKGAFGFYGYEFSGAELSVKGEKSVHALVPSGYQLLVNGKEVGEAYQIGSSEHEWNSYLPKGVPGISMVEIQISGLFSEPTLAAKSPEGEEVALNFDEEKGLYRAELSYEKEVDSALSGRILTGMKEYAAYIQNDGSIGRVSPYFDTGSMFYRNTASNPSMFVWDHNGYYFRDESIKDFYYFDENTLCCRVTFDQVLKKYGSEDYVDRIDMTVFVRKIGSTWRIFDRFVW